MRLSRTAVRFNGPRKSLVMYCLLCHEKIPRLRAWRTKSEFCCDEHAAQYKKQTLDRLLTDQNPARKETPNPIALADEADDDLIHDEMAPEAAGASDVHTHTSEEVEATIEPSFAAVPDLEAGSTDPSDGVEELWRLAEESGHSDADTDLPDTRFDDLEDRFGEPEVARQSAEEALQALRMLADKASEPKDSDDDQRAADSSPSFFSESESFDQDSPSITELEDLPPISDDLMAELNGELPAFDDHLTDDASPVDAIVQSEASERNRDETDSPEFEAEAPSSPVGAAPEGLHEADDDAPSILERLMEDPAANWNPPEPEAAPPSPPAPQQESPEALSELDDDPLAYFTELPEPEFAFDDDPLDAAAEAKQSEAVDAEQETAPANAVAEADDAEAVEEPVEDDLHDLQTEDDPLADFAAIADDLEESLDDEPEFDPLAELIKAEEAVQAQSEAEDDEDDFDEAVADELVNELAEQSLRDDVDLQELERSLKVVPFPSPNKSPGKNGHHKHANQIADAPDEAVESHPLPPSEPAAEKTASVKPPARRARPQRSNRRHTKFKPSMVMAGIEPSIQGYLQGDPHETWRATAVESAWGETGLPNVLSFEASAQIASADSELKAFRPERDFQGRMGLSIAMCTPAEAPATEAPAASLEPTRMESATLPPEAFSLDVESSMRLGPEYRVFDDIAAINTALGPAGDSQDSSDVSELAAAGLPGALAPTGLFFDSISAETRFVDEDEWDGAEEPPSEGQGIDLSADFEDQQPAAQSSGGRRQY